MTGSGGPDSFRARLAAARARTDAIFDLLPGEALRSRPIPERHRFVFYLGHLEAFDANLLRHATAVPSVAPELDRLFAFGIDPVDGDLPDEPESFWPPTDAVRRYGHRVRELVDGALPRSGATVEPPLAQVLEAALEHRLMHAETMAYMVARLPLDERAALPTCRDGAEPEPRRISIPAGRATLGKRSGDGFGWDNEHEESEVAVPAFTIDAHPVTNGQYLEFVKDGGYEERAHWSDAAWEYRRLHGFLEPATWSRPDGGTAWQLRTTFARIPLPHSWPVWVSHAEASAYARWAGGRLPTEAEWHRAAFGTPSGGERRFPWGDAPFTPERGNAGEERWDPVPVTHHPRGASAFGVEDLVGNGWEWTSTVFAPLPGFAPLPFYPGYSAPFFDGRHFVLKGGGPRTAVRFLRRSFRNWFQPHYPHVQAKLRCVRDVEKES